MGAEPVEKPGPRRSRIYARLIRFSGASEAERPGAARVRIWLAELDRVGRLVAAGATRSPEGHLVLLRAANLPEAERVLRSDPFEENGLDERRVLEWEPNGWGTGVNLEPPPARGAGRLTGLHRVAVFVRDQRDAERFYREVLGLSVREADPETGFLEVSLGPGAAGLTLVEPRPAWGEPYHAEARGRIGQGTGIAFRTDNVEALALRLEHAGARVTQRPRSEPWGGRSIRFGDPDGNEFLAFDSGPATPVERPARSRRLHRRKPADGGTTP